MACDSIYLTDRPAEMRADMLLEYDRGSRTVRRCVSCREARYGKLDALAAGVSIEAMCPGLFSVLDYWDVLGRPSNVFFGGRLAPDLQPAKNVAVFTLSLIAARKHFLRAWTESDEKSCISLLADRVSAAYGKARVLEVRGRSDAVYVDVGFSDGERLDPALMDPDSPLPGNDVKFFCDCGQFKNKGEFLSKRAFVKDASGNAAAGFYYNDSGLDCADYVSTGGGGFFRNLGYVDRGYVSHRHSAYSYYARARNLDESKVRFIPRLGRAEGDIFSPDAAYGSVEEFAVHRAATEEGLRPGDACYMYATVVDPEGEPRSVTAYPVWDGARWIDYYRETEISGWPELEPGWRMA